MKYLHQFMIIMGVTCIGELMHYFISLPIPASIYGLVLMLVLLLTGILKINQVWSSAQFLVEIMPVMFIPAAVGLINYWDALKPILIPALIIVLGSTIIVMGVTGKCAEWIIKKNGGSR
jgi:holin-like protein